jgi:hypothetical protein
MIISEVSRSSRTLATVSFLPSSVVAPPRPPPKRAVSTILICWGLVTGEVKAVAVAARQSVPNIDFIIFSCVCVWQ